MKRDRPLLLGDSKDTPQWKPSRWGAHTEPRPVSMMAGSVNPLAPGPSLLGTPTKRTSNPETKHGYEAALSFYSNDPKPKPKPSVEIDLAKFEPYNSPSPSQSRKSRSLTSYSSAETAVDPVRRSNSITAGTPVPAEEPKPAQESHHMYGAGLWESLTGVLKTPTRPATLPAATTTTPAISSIAPTNTKEATLPPREEKRASVPITVTTKVLNLSTEKSAPPPVVEKPAPQQQEPLPTLPQVSNMEPLGLVPPVTNDIKDEEEPDDTPLENKIILDDDKLLKVARFKMKTNDGLSEELHELKKKYQEALVSIEQLTERLNKESEKVVGLEEEVKQLTRHNTRLVEIVQQHARVGPAATIATASPAKPNLPTGPAATPTKAKNKPPTGKLW